VNKWPNEVKLLFLAAASKAVIDHQHAEKLRAHINLLWLADTPEDTIIYEISILAEAMEGSLCAN
jgi:hypothetical protein